MKIILTKKAELKLKYFVDLTPGEISGLGKTRIKDEEIIVEDIIIFEQTCTSASTIIEDGAQAKFLFELMKKEEDPSNWNLWWHSHASMGVFWSTTDDATIKDHREQTHIISLVTNKKGEFKARLDIFPKDESPFSKFLFHTVDLEVQREDLWDEKLYAHCMKEIEKKIKTFKPTPLVTSKVYNPKDYLPKKWNEDKWDRWERQGKYYDGYEEDYTPSPWVKSQAQKDEKTPYKYSEEDKALYKDVTGVEFDADFNDEDLINKDFPPIGFN